MISEDINDNITLENQVVDQPFETHIIEDVDMNGHFVSSSENEDVNDIDIGLEYDEDESIMGKVFNTPKNAYTFYNRYAFLHGFGIRTHWGYKNKTTKDFYRKMYVCNKQGFKRLKGANSCGNTKQRRRALRTGCEAMLRISKRKDGKWFVDIFNDTHNHELSITPTKVMKHRSHAKFHRSMACKSLMVEFGQSGLKPSQIKKAVNAIKSPYEADVTSKQCVDVLSEQRRNYKGKEFYGLIKHFQDKALVDTNQYFVVDLFEDGSPRNIFWADGRSRDAYTKFGDVVVFDVTYMTNKFKMPFSPFVGVNHHGQSILFGGALLENEKEETFKWLFEHFLKCMFEKYPSAIITDQDKAIGNAISKVFPNTRHRFCAWHIKKHEQVHLRPLVARYSDFKDSYKSWIKCDTIEEFEIKWEGIRDKYNLENKSWLTEMYYQRKHWAKAFLKDVFFAGMTTSERSESIQSFFDGFVNSKTMLNEFVVQYDKAVHSRRAAEEDEDFKTMNSKPVLFSVHPIEAKAGECYTRKMFEAFKKEWIEAMGNLTHETLSKSTKKIKYRVGQLNVDKMHWRIVTFHFLNPINVKCSCAKFETYGILCKHSLYVIKKRHVETLPDHYILPRWTLDARFKVDSTNIGLEEINNENGVSALTEWCVRANYNKAIELVRDSSFEIRKLNNFLVKFLEDQLSRKKAKGHPNTSQESCAGISQVDMVPQISIRDPLLPTNTKGRPKNANRIKSSLEMVKKKRTCSHCGGLGHYISGCSIKKAEEALKDKELYGK
ncbi:protein FAR1-RELATED SEQUENCE 7-like [Lactuca sativa]|uniref:protein FAR1-RELATED SEQUENCE 7-like n=1 Tax=Lactuca sativa TaxID=4236 RepID=UPI000CD8EB2A|nr:protein FAR1-RELATED SEQUENCE 7-like [Lactuca sativa]